MFQISNPLRFYTRHSSRQVQKEENVSNLLSKQNNSKNTTRILSWVLYLAIVILSAIFFLGAGLILLEQINEKSIFPENNKNSEKAEVESVSGSTTNVKESTRDKTEEISSQKNINSSGRCEGCLSFEEMKKKAEISVLNAEGYIKEKISRVRIPEIGMIDENLVVFMESISSQLENFPDIKQKINELTSLNKTFNVALNEALFSQNEAKILEERFRLKVSEVEGISIKISGYLNTTSNLDKAKEQCELTIKDIERKINHENVKFEKEKETLGVLLENIQSSVQQELKEVQAMSLKHLEDILETTNKEIQYFGENSVDCQAIVPTKKTQITYLQSIFQELNSNLDNVETQISRLNWMEHVRKTIEEFEKIQTKIQELRKHQLEKGQENLESLINGLKVKQTNLTNILNEPKKVVERKKVQVKKDGNKTSITTVYQSFEATLNEESFLRNSLKKEQNLLRVWASEQFKIYNISTNEIKNITNTINNLKATVQGETENLGKYDSEKTEIKRKIHQVKIELETHEKQYKSCQEIINDNQKQAEIRRKELVKLEEVLGRVKQLQNRVEREEDDIMAGERIHREKIRDLQDEQYHIRTMISETTKNKTQIEQHLNFLVTSLNQQIMTDPQSEAVEEKFRENQRKVRKARELYHDLVNLIEKIKKKS